MGKTFFIVTFSLFILLNCGGCTMLQPKQNIPSVDDVGDNATKIWRTVNRVGWLVPLCVIGIGASLAAYKFGLKDFGSAGLVGFSGSLFTALAVARFPLLMAIIGLVGALGAYIYNGLIKNKALKEIIANVQSAKGYMTSSTLKDVREELDKQSNSTKRIVKNTKARLLRGAENNE